MNNPKKLYRSKSNKVIAGVCGGIGGYFNIDPVILRLLVILATIISGGIIILTYILAIIIIPKENDTNIIDV